MIEEFKDEYSWLSNMAPFEKPFIHNGLRYRTNEHFYVAMKTKDTFNRIELAQNIKSPGKVKRLGRTFEIREDWNDIRLAVMLQGLRYKFSKSNPILRQKLLDTGDQYIQEGNSWGDSFWGYCFTDEMGKNHLGRLLMQVRFEIRVVDNCDSISSLDIPEEYGRLVNENFWDLV
jgi:hypothetical protein